MPSAASVAILAGGRASRFGGRDKGGLIVGGRSIRDRQVAELSALSSDLMIVGGPASRVATLSAAPWRHVPDRLADRGPLGGLDAALDAAAHDAVVIVACDMPFVSARLFRFMLASAGEADAVVPRTMRGYHPLCAVYTRACQAAVKRRLSEEGLALFGLLDDVRVRVITEAEIAAFGDSARLLANVNTASDYERIEALTQHQL